MGLGNSYWQSQLCTDPIGAATRIQSANDWWDSTLPDEIQYQLEHSNQVLATDNVATTARDSKDIPDHWYNRQSNRMTHNLDQVIDGIPAINEGNGAFKQWLIQYDGAKFTPSDITANPVLLQWTIKVAGYFNNTPDGRNIIHNNSFMQSMGSALSDYGKLTAGQAKGVLNWYRSHLHYQSNQSKSEGTTKVEGLDISSIPSGMYADPNPEDPNNRLKVKVNNFIDQLNSKWKGWVFVNDGAEYGSQRKYGAQRPSSPSNPQYYQGQIADVLERIKANPVAAMVAYGHLTGTCGRCGRKLEDEESVRIGIGPVCARHMGMDV